MHVAGPTIDLSVEHPDADAVVVRVSGVPGHADAAVLRRTLDQELDRAPALLVVELDHAVATAEVREVLATARDRARTAGGGLRVVRAGHVDGHAVEITELL